MAALDDEMRDRNWIAAIGFNGSMEDHSNGALDKKTESTTSVAIVFGGDRTAMANTGHKRRTQLCGC